MPKGTRSQSAVSQRAEAADIPYQDVYDAARAAKGPSLWGEDRGFSDKELAEAVRTVKKRRAETERFRQTVRRLWEECT